MTQSLQICQQTLSLLTPFLALKREQERGIHAKVGGSIANGLRAVFGVKHLRAKLATAAIVALLALTSQFVQDLRRSHPAWPDTFG